MTTIFKIIPYKNVLLGSHFPKYLFNSFMISLSTVLITIPFSLLAADGVSRFSFWGKTFILFMIIILFTLPSISLVAALYKLFYALGWINLPISLICTYSAHNFPLAFFLLAKYLDKIPIEMDSAALMDGCNYFQTFRYVIHLKRLQRKSNITTIYVTHDQTEALTLGDRIAIMDKGHLQQIDTPEETYRRPRNVFVAGFIGTPPMNMAQIRICNSHSFKIGEVTVECPFLLPNKDQIILGIRPEKIAVVPLNAPFIILGKIEYIEYLGSESVCHVEIAKENVYSLPVALISVTLTTSPSEKVLNLIVYNLFILTKTN